MNPNSESNVPVPLPTDEGIETLDRYSDVNTSNGDLVIYDELNDDAWIQCSFWIQVEMME